ncbi:golgi-associated plant pathogenesis-related protein 1 [Nephila pilipes]|uniref:Golgi-associated plant pathogenesis-related protein 1 n=1 Tax=Nephila pilipes TaxID=299642 RepID=A0A8X6JT33_NEPPI|nr:golgi-associated plant pathogenesis-related protein 1 [Nephila pilipes]
MDCLLQKLKGLRASKVESPKYRRQRTTVRDKSSQASASDTSSYYSASSNFIDKVILGRHIYVRGNGYEQPDFAESEFVIDCLHWHNVFREKHDVAPLKLNNQVISDFLPSFFFFFFFTAS